MNNLDLNYRFNNKIIDINECNKLINNNYKNLIGRGGQGSVFKLSSNKCIKLFYWRCKPIHRKYSFCIIWPFVCTIIHS